MQVRGLVPLLSHELVKPSTDICPLPRSGHRIVADESNIYVIGGYVQYSNRLNVEGEVWRYNILTSTWNRLSIKNCNFRLAASHAVAKIGHTVVVHGGTGTNFGYEVDNSLLVLDLKRCTSYSLAFTAKDENINNIPMHTYGHTLSFVVFQGEPFLYKVGGALGSTYTMNIYRYSLHEKTWECMYNEVRNFDRSLPARYRHDTAVHNNKLHIVGGCTSFTVQPIWPMPLFSLETNSWEIVSFTGRKPPLMKYQSSAQHRQHVYIVGGVTNDPQVINRFLFMLDLDTLTCCYVGVQSKPTYFHDLVIIPQLGELYSFGGVVSVEPVQRTEELHRFRLLNCVLPLKELAWSRVVQLLNRLKLFAFSKLSNTEANATCQAVAASQSPHPFSASLSSSQGDMVLRCSLSKAMQLAEKSIGLYSVHGLPEDPSVPNTLSNSNEQAVPTGSQHSVRYADRSCTGARVVSHSSSGRFNVSDPIEELYLISILYFLGVPEQFIQRFPSAISCTRFLRTKIDPD